MKKIQNDLKSKDDAGKVRLDLVTPEFILSTAKVMTYAIEEKHYKEYSWQKVHNPIDRYYAALMRHTLTWRSGEIYDEESGFHHLAHASCCVMILLWFELKDKLIRRKKDD